jgi:hypothetical protein
MTRFDAICPIHHVRTHPIIVPSRPHLLATLLVVGLFLVMNAPALAATDPSQNIPAQCQAIAGQASAAQSGQAIAPSAVIVTDTSESMKGFALPKSVRLYSLHEAIERAARDAIVAVSGSPAGNPERCTLGKSLDCKSKLALASFDTAAIYKSTESRLDLFFQKNIDKPLESVLDNHLLSLLVTDGMQALSGSSGNDQCLSGADPACIIHLLTQRIQEGYGAWIMLIYLPFKGRHFAERPLDESSWGQIQAHIEELKNDPIFSEISASTLVKRESKAVPFKTFHYEGAKPLLLLALSKNPEAGRAFVAKISASLPKAGIALPAAAIYPLELAPLAVVGRKLNKLSLSPKDPLQALMPVTGKRGGGGNYYDYLLECDFGGFGTLITTFEENINSTGGDLPFQSRLGFTGDGNLPPNQLHILPGNQQYKLQVSCKNLKKGSYATWLKYESALMLSASSDTFWRHLSADNTFQYPERLYGLSELVEAALKTVMVTPRVHDCIRIRVERK